VVEIVGNILFAVHVEHKCASGVYQGNDGVIECVHQVKDNIESVNVYKSWNVPGRRQNQRVEGSEGVSLDRTTVIGDAIYCEVTVDPVLKIEKNTYDLDRDDYFFLLAAGSSLKSTRYLRIDY